MMTLNRARSPEAKQKQLKRIIKTGEELFLRKGTEKFSMRELARLLKMSPGNLYNYVTSERELWFAIVKQYFDELVEEMKAVIRSHDGNYMELIEKLANHYLEMGRKDLRRYQMMFLIPPPAAQAVGPYERTYEYTIIHVFSEVVQRAIQAGEIEETNPNYLTFYLWAVVHGAVTIYYTTSELADEVRPAGEIKDFHNFVLRQLFDQYHKIEHQT